MADSGITYRRRYLATLQVAPVLDLLLTDDSNPRSLLFQLEALSEHWQALGAAGAVAARAGQSPIRRRCWRSCRRWTSRRWRSMDERGRRPALDALLGRLGLALPALSHLLSAGYLNHATVSRGT